MVLVTRYLALLSTKHQHSAGQTTAYFICILLPYHPKFLALIERFCLPNLSQIVALRIDRL
jgi:hypothetical protein